MKREEVFKAVVAAIREVKKIEDVKITDATDMVMDLGFNSLTFFFLVVNLEGKLGKKIPERKMRSISLVGELVDILL